MISRLLLVGMVGVLGISLPDGADLGGKLTWARTGATACACRRGAVTFEPIAVGDDSIDRIADELNRRSEGLDLPMTAVVRVVPKDRPVAMESIDVVARLFAENRVWGEPAAGAGLPPALGSRPRFEPIAVAEGPSSLADELNRASEGIDLDPAAMAVRAPRRPSFEPIAVAEGPSSLADELNRASEGLDLVREPEPTVGRALRLTHDAALAWMSVLTKTMATSHAVR